VTFSAFAGLCLTLAIVLGLAAVTLRVLRRASGLAGPGASAPRIPLEVVQRVAVGPRQGIAVVRIGDQTIAVSVGDGGVRHIADLEALPLPVVAHQPSVSTAGFGAALRSRLRAAGIPLAMVIGTALGLPFSGAAQSPAATPAPATAQATTPATGGRATAARPATVVPPTTPGTSLDQALGRALPALDLSFGRTEAGGLRLSGSVGIVIMLGLLTLLPTLILMMTSFTRILIVLNFVKQAIGTQNAPPGHLIAALSLILTGFVMAPTMREVNRAALTPWLDGQIEQGAMMRNALGPMREFMLRQTRESDVATFVDLSGGPPPPRPEAVSTIVLLSAFVTSELRTAFQLGFVLFLPFIVIDLVVSSVLMSLGMFMLPPAMIALPFKLLLFVLVDGWSLLIQSLVQGFR
jgi:flagellar biosynthetic protein FliP